MSEKFAKGNKAGVPVRVEPGKPNEIKPKKAAAHRQVIQDAARYTQSSDTSVSDTQNNITDDYESGKVAPKRKASKYDDDIKMVQDLDRWG